MILEIDKTQLSAEELGEISGGVILDRTDVFPYDCYDENTGERIGVKWTLEEAEELCRSHNCSTNLFPIDQAHQLQAHMRKQRFNVKRNKKQ